MELFDRTLTNKDVAEKLSCDEHTAHDLLVHFGKKSQTGRWWISEREFMLLRMEGRITEWLKEAGRLGRTNLAADDYE